MAAPPGAAAWTVVSNVAYNAAIGTAGLGHLYLPADHAPDTPVALAIHGGGWSAGDRASWAGVAEFLCNDLGFAVFNIEYRLTGVGPWPLCGNDCIDAANFLLSDAFAQRFGIDCRRVWPCGGSAGGHLALWTGLSLPPDKVGGIISISGIGDLQPDAVANPSRYVSLFGHVPTTQELINASPMSRVTAASPPVFCSHAVPDTVVPPACSQHFIDACRAAGVRADAYTYAQRDTGHSIWIPGSNPHRLFSDIEAAIAAFVWSLKGGGLSVGQDAFYTDLTLTNDTLVIRPLIDQSLRTLGPGTATFLNPRMPRAGIDVINGDLAVTVSDTFAAPLLPEGLKQKAAFWVDAATHVIADSEGRVSRWHDVRETLTQGPWRYMMATNAEAARQPRLVTAAAPGDKTYLDFGVWGDPATNTASRWLFWAGTNGAPKALALRALFMVFGSHNGNGAGGGLCLIQNAASLTPAPTAPFAGASDRLWLNNDNVLADDGVNWLDRRMRDGRALQIRDKAYHLVETFTLQAARADTFAKDRTFPGYSGGVRICEALFFTTELTDAERLLVEDYLWSKWFARQGDAALGAYRLEESSGLRLQLGTNAATATVSGSGTIAKSGAAPLTLTNGAERAFGGTVKLHEGALTAIGAPFLMDVDAGGQILNVQGSTTLRQPAPDAGSLRKSGSGELAIAALDAGITSVVVEAGTLRLATPMAPAYPPPADAAVTEASLEAFVAELRPSLTYRAYLNTTAHGWSFTQDVATVGTGFHAGIALDDAGGLMPPGSAPDGDAVLYLNRGQASTPFEVPTSGVYRLSFHAAGRIGYLNRHVIVSVDGMPVRTLATRSTAFCQHAVMLPFLPAGTHVLGFRGKGPDNNGASLLDAIRVTAVRLCPAAPVLATVTNASFEEPVEQFETAVMTTAPTGTGWTFEGTAGTGCIQSADPVLRQMPSAVPEGMAAAWLAGSGSLRQSVQIPLAGDYRLTFSAAAMPGRVNHAFEIRFDGAPLAAFTTTDTLFERRALHLPGLSTGASAELAFAGKGATSTASLIDDIRIERCEDSHAALRRTLAGRFPETLSLDLAAGTALILDYDGTVPLNALRYGGRPLAGMIDAASEPGFVSGTGRLAVPVHGTRVRIQ